MPTPHPSHTPQPRYNDVLTKAVIRAAEILDIKPGILRRVLGNSAPTISRMKNGTYQLNSATKETELGILFVRMFRSLDAIAGGDAKVARSWMNNPNTALGMAPIDKIQTISGLTDVIAYLDARRAVV